MQLFIYIEKGPDGKMKTKDVMANSRKDAARKAGVPLKYVQLQTRKQ